MRHVVVAALVLASGCYSPSYNNPSCPTGECPDGLMCVEGVCVDPNTVVDAAEADAAEVDVADVDTPEVDAPDDAPMIDARDASMIDARDASMIDARDASMIDAIDAMTDAPTDAPDAMTTVTYNGTIAVVESQVLLAGTTNTLLGQGVTISTGFTPSNVNAPVAEEMPGQLLGCKAYVFDTTSEINSSGGLNEGTVTVTVANGGTPANPTFPTCVFAPTTPPSMPAGYYCPDTGSSGTFSTGAPGTFTLATTNAYSFSTTAASFSADDVGRTIFFAGTSSAVVDNKGFVIVSFTNASSVVLAMTTAPPGTVNAGTFQTVAGGGVNPALTADPGQLSNAASVSVSLDASTTGSQNHFGNFTGTVANVGDDFTITDATANLMRSIPRNGTAFTIGCSTCGSSLGSVLSIVTTNGAVSAADPYAMPRPASKRVQVVCIGSLTDSVTVPAAYSAYIMNSGATRIQTTFARIAPTTPSTNPNSTATIVAGHSIVGFTTP